MPVRRTLLFCSLYDNGSTPDSPPVKRRSTSPVPPLPIGGPCDLDEVACFHEGANKGDLCGGNDGACDTTPGSGDGVCDACPLRGGFTTEDEMFILLGNYYVDRARQGAIRRRRLSVASSSGNRVQRGRQPPGRSPL